MVPYYAFGDMMTFVRRHGRSLGVALIVAQSVAWGAAPAHAAVARPRIVQQDASVQLTRSGSGVLAIATRTPQGRSSSVSVTIFQAVQSRSAVASVINGANPGLQEIDSTGNIELTCRKADIARFDVGIGTWPRGGAACGSAKPVLRVECGTSCSGVFPLRYSFQVDNTRRDLWSLVTLISGQPQETTPVALLAKSAPLTPVYRFREVASLNALSQHHIESSVTLSYGDAVNATFAPGGVAAEWRRALASYLGDSRHHLVPLGPTGADYGALRAVGLGTEIPLHFSTTDQLIGSGTGRTPNSNPIMVSGPLTPRSLDALALHGRRRVIVTESSLRTKPSSLSHWGVPFSVARTTRGSLVIATDSSLSERSQDQTLEPARRIAITVGEMMLLRAQHPEKASSQSIVISTSLRLAGPLFLSGFSDAVRMTGLFRFVGPDDLFTVTPGTNGAPLARRLNAYPGAQWQPDDIRRVAQLASSTASLRSAFTSPQPLLRAEAARLLAEVPTSEREELIGVAQRQFASELGQFRVDQSTITLTGGGSDVPITVTSGANYAFTGLIRVASDRVTFTSGHQFPVTLGTPINTIRVPINIGSGTSAFIRVSLLTADGRVTLTSGTVQIRYTSTSIVGYLLSAGSLLIIGWWWWRTSRRTKLRVVRP